MLSTNVQGYKVLDRSRVVTIFVTSYQFKQYRSYSDNSCKAADHNKRQLVLLISGNKHFISEGLRLETDVKTLGEHGVVVSFRSVQGRDQVRISIISQLLGPLSKSFILTLLVWSVTNINACGGEKQSCVKMTNWTENAGCDNEPLQENCPANLAADSAISI